MPYVGDYYYDETRRELGRGAFGVVHQGQDRTTDAVNVKVAIKVIANEHIDPREMTILQELRTLKHDNLVQLKCIRRVGGRLYLIMELCNRGDLGKYLLGGTRIIDECTILCFFRQIAKGLKALHEKNIIHRNLTPQNILLHTSHCRENWEEIPAEIVVKIGDFGLARILPENETTERIAGTPAYAAPEALSQPYNAKADLWSVGMILFQCVAGRVAFQYIDGRMSSNPLIPQIPSHCSQLLSQLILGLLKRNADDRMEFDEFFLHPFFQQAKNISLPNGLYYIRSQSDYLDPIDCHIKGANLIRDKLLIERHQNGTITLRQSIQTNHYMRVALESPYRRVCFSSEPACPYNIEFKLLITKNYGGYIICWTDSNGIDRYVCVHENRLVIDETEISRANYFNFESDMEFFVHCVPSGVYYIRDSETGEYFIEDGNEVKLTNGNNDDEQFAIKKKFNLQYINNTTSFLLSSFESGRNITYDLTRHLTCGSRLLQSLGLMSAVPVPLIFDRRTFGFQYTNQWKEYAHFELSKLNLSQNGLIVSLCIYERGNKYNIIKRGSNICLQSGANNELTIHFERVGRLFHFEWPVNDWSRAPNEVFITGTYWNWEILNRMERTRDGFLFSLDLNLNNGNNGPFLFKFVVDGNWMTSSHFFTQTDDGGNENNYLPF